MYNFTGRNIQMHSIRPGPYWVDRLLPPEGNVRNINMHENQEDSGGVRGADSHKASEYQVFTGTSLYGHVQIQMSTNQCCVEAHS